MKKKGLDSFYNMAKILTEHLKTVTLRTVLKPQSDTVTRCKPQIDPDKPRTQNQHEVIISKTHAKVYTVHDIRENKSGKPVEVRYLKTNPTVPSFMDWSPAHRTGFIAVLATYRQIPSIRIAGVLGSTPGQVGAIRRWHDKKWDVRK